MDVQMVQSVTVHDTHFEGCLRAQRDGDYMMALHCLRDGASIGEGDCIWWMGSLYYWGLWVEEESEEKAMQWWDRGIAMGNVRCMAEKYAEGRAEGRGGAGHKALYQSVMESSDLYAQGVVQHRAERKAELWGLGADQGDPFCQTALAGALCNKKSFLKNPIRGVELYFKAATSGWIWAQTGLADCFETGNGVEVNLQSAIEWYERAAKQGWWFSQRCLVDLWMKIPNAGAARYWYMKCQSNEVFQALVARGVVSSASDEYQFEQTEACFTACVTVLCIRRFRQSLLSVLPKEVVFIVLRRLWETRLEDGLWNRSITQ